LMWYGSFGMPAVEFPCTWNVAVLSVSLELGRYVVCPSAEVIVIAPATSVVLLVTATPLVLTLTMGRLIDPEAGTNAGFEMETVRKNCAVERLAPAAATSVTGAVQLVLAES
jgi:hypothetical protein